MKKQLHTLCIFLIILLFAYSAAAKLLDITRFRYEMLNQPFPRWIAQSFVWLVPAFEISIIILLLFSRTRALGFWLAWSLILLFTLYTALILHHAFGRVPCSCGGIINRLTWKQHLYFNICFLLIASAGVYTECRKLMINIFQAPETGQTENL